MAGYSDLSPGRFLLPGDLAGSPALTFAPIPKPTGSIRKTFWAEMKRRYDAYKAHVVRPFFRDHFSKIDGQIVLVDLLSALDNGPDALSNLQRTISDVVRTFRPGQNSFLTRLVSGQRVEKSYLLQPKLIICTTHSTAITPISCVRSWMMHCDTQNFGGPKLQLFHWPVCAAQPRHYTRIIHACVAPG